MQIGVRKIIALSVTAAYIGMTIYSLVLSTNVPETYTSITGIIIGYYFGKSTALETP